MQTFKMFGVKMKNKIDKLNRVKQIPDIAINGQRLQDQIMLNDINN